MEIWKDIQGYEGMYQVSDLGRVRSLNRIDCAGRRLKGTLMKLSKTRGDYLMVGLTKNGETKLFRINRLVAMMFIPNPNELPEVGHDDDDRQNNRVQNLYWTDRSENCTHNDRHKRVGEKIGKAIIGESSCSVIRFKSSLEAERNGFNSSAIRNCLTGRSRTHNGYTWSYA
ncbi:NUMOD4 domain-containing protein [Cohnella sp.]|uniref:NUMOD4 domain-containing protein n=1 Tax=Cohnella sp. TaxID=1883426 RepID=UPI00356782BA